MKEFDFDKFEKHIPEFTGKLKEQLQTRLFHPIAPAFEIEINVFERGRGHGKFIAVESSDIAEHMNFKMFEKVRFHNFGGGSIDQTNEFWLSVNWRWEHVGGGSNGANALRLRITDEGEILEVRDNI